MANVDDELRLQEWLAFWDGMKQLNATGQHDLKMIADLRCSLGMPPVLPHQLIST